MKKMRISVVLLIAAFILVSCASQPPPQSTPPAANNTTPSAGGVSAPGYVEILIPGRNFTPDSLTVSVGTTVNWVSKDGEVHTVTSDIPNLINGTIDAFGSFAYTFNQTGDYEYFCSIHGQMGMRGVVHVK